MKKKSVPTARSTTVQVLIAAFLFAAAGFYFTDHAHAENLWQKIPGSYILLGFAGAYLLMGAAKQLGKRFLYREPDYYED